MEVSQTKLFDLKEVKVPPSFNAPQTARLVANAYIKGIMAEKPSSNSGTSLEVTLKHIFPEKQDENKLQKARLIMGEAVKDLSDEELETFITEFKYLIEAWVDSFERQIFDNKTLKQLLKEG